MALWKGVAMDRRLALDNETTLYAPTTPVLSNSRKCGFQQNCVVGDTKKDNLIKVSINCPKCMIKLGFSAEPSQQKLTGSTNKISHGGGDNEDSFGSIRLNKGAARNTQNMSYTVVKGSVSLPDTKILDTTNDRRKVQSRGCELEVQSIPLKTGQTYDCLQTSQCDEKSSDPVPSATFNTPCCPPPSLSPPSNSSFNNDIRAGRTPHSNSRHCSFADPIVSNIDSEVSFKLPQMNDSQEDISYPYLQSSNPNRRCLRFVDNSEHLFEKASQLGFGIDLEDDVPLYESSSASSCCEDQDSSEVSTKRCKNDEKAKSSVSHNAPVEYNAANSGLLTANSQANQDGYQMIGDHLSPEEIDILKTDIPQHRQDLYKDCFTLFVEQWFGKRSD